MTRLSNIWIIILPAFLFFSCKEEEKVNVNRFINHYQLEQDRYRLVNGLDIKMKLYANSEIDTSLILVIDKQGDTLVKHLGKNGNSVQEIYEKDGEHFIKINTMFSEIKYYGLGYSQIKRKNYYIDSLQYFILNKKKNAFEKIHRISNDSLVELAKHILKIDTPIKLKGNPSSNYYLVSRDTLDDYQRYYAIQTERYDLKKIDNIYLLVPLVARLSQGSEGNLGKDFLYKNGVRIYDNYIGTTLESLNDRKGNAKYLLEIRVYLKFEDVLNQEIVKSQLIVKEMELNNHLKTLRNEWVLKNFTKNPKNDLVFTEFDIIKYQNQEYFLGLLPQVSLHNYQNSVFHLDTINWKINPVKEYNSKFDKSFKEIKKGENMFLSGDILGKVSGFLQDFKIVKVKDEYRLIKKNK